MIPSWADQTLATAWAVGRAVGSASRARSMRCGRSGSSSPSELEALLPHRIDRERLADPKDRPAPPIAATA